MRQIKWRDPHTGEAHYEPFVSDDEFMDIGLYLYGTGVRNPRLERFWNWYQSFNGRRPTGDQFSQWLESQPDVNVTDVVSEEHLN